MRVELAAVYGFCPGVRRAVEMVEKHLRHKGPLATLVAISAHGAGPEVFEEIRRRGLSLVDTTCPIVRRAQEAAHRLSEQGFFVLIYGEEVHPEVRGLLSWTRGRGIAALDSADIPEYLGERLALISQTTKGREEFWRFVSAVVARLRPKPREVWALDTTCPETGRRYQAVQDLARRVQALVVVGSRNSANTRKLAEVAKGTGLPTFHIERAEELQSEWFQGVQQVGVTAGASTPDSLVREVVDHLRQMGGDP